MIGFFEIELDDGIEQYRMSENYRCYKRFVDEFGYADPWKRIGDSEYSEAWDIYEAKRKEAVQCVD